MLCPVYEGGNRCGYKSEYYLLTEEHVNQLCTGNPANCTTRKEHEQSSTRDTEIKERRRPVIPEEPRTFPHEDPNSPGYHPYKKGGDNPDPRKRY